MNAARGPTSSGGGEGLDELRVALKKIDTLRSSLSHFTSHLSSLTDRLASSQSSLAALQLSHARSTATHAQELLALQALCAVWEGRWREERRLREEAEEKLAAELARGGGKGRSLNGKERRKETEVSSLKPLAQPPRPSHSHSRSASSSSATSSAASCTPVRHRKTSATRPAKRSRSSKSALLAHLSQELAREKRRAGRKLAEKDEEIARLTADQTSRRSEAQKLFDSLDTLLSLGGLSSLPQAVPLPPATEGEAEELSSPPPPRPHSSILAHPSLAAAAAHSRSRSQHLRSQDRTLSVEEDERRRETLGLEEEVRELENEIARLNADRSRATLDAESSTPAEPDPAADRQSLLLTIDELNAQVERLQFELREAKNERAALRRMVEERYQHVQHSHHDSPDESLLVKVEDLEAERDRLAHLLHLSESECASLSTQLSATHSSIDALSLRIRRKLEEQKDKLRRAYEESEEWARRAEEGEREVAELRRVVEGYERRMGRSGRGGVGGREAGSGSGSGSGSGGSID